MTALPDARPASATQNDSAMGLVGAWIGDLFSGFFALTQSAAQLRASLWFVSAMLLGMLIVLIYTPIGAWLQQLELIAGVLLDSTITTQQRTGITYGFIFFCLNATVFNAQVLRLSISLFLPFWLGRQIASIYLADIFDKEFGVARKFVLQAAFADQYNVIHISQGRVAEADQDSPIVQIGGPGLIQVELDSAVLTEKPDGSSQVIGPTGNRRWQKLVLEGFERIRQGVDLRDRDDSASFTFRSRDGIPIGVRDVRWTSSIHRGAQPPSKTLPYPFEEAAVRAQIYQAGRAVPPSKAAQKADWQTALPGRTAGQVGGALGKFISDHGLGEFLASIGEPELKDLRERQAALARASGKIAGEHSSAAAPPAGDAPAHEKMHFVSRDFISALFHAEKYREAASERGVEFPWVGVGTWDPHAQIPEDHLDAWKISRENLARSDPSHLARRRDEARLQELQSLIQKELLGAYYHYKETGKPARAIVHKLLSDYYESLSLGRQLFARAQMDIPLELVDAIQALEDLREQGQWGIHWVEADG